MRVAEIANNIKNYILNIQNDKIYLCKIKANLEEANDRHVEIGDSLDKILLQIQDTDNNINEIEKELESNLFILVDIEKKISRFDPDIDFKDVTTFIDKYTMIQNKLDND